MTNLIIPDELQGYIGNTGLQVQESNFDIVKMPRENHYTADMRVLSKPQRYLRKAWIHSEKFLPDRLLALQL